MMQNVPDLIVETAIAELKRAIANAAETRPDVVCPAHPAVVDLGCATARFQLAVWESAQQGLKETRADRKRIVVSIRDQLITRAIGVVLSVVMIGLGYVLGSWREILALLEKK